ncbi:MAG: helix-turn-helix domain-containing protein [Actinomycetota bacterium]
MNTPHPPTTEAHKLAYNINEAAQALGVGRSTLYKLINNGALPSTTIGSRRLIFRQDLDEFVERERRRNARSEERR